MAYPECHTQEKIDCPFQFMSRPMKTDGTHEWYYACKNETVRKVLEILDEGFTKV